MEVKIVIFNPLGDKPTKWSNLLCCCQRIVWLCLTILWAWRLKSWNNNDIKNCFSIIYKNYPRIFSECLLLNLLWWKSSTPKIMHEALINPFHATDLFWYSLKTSEKQRFSDVFKGYQKRSVAWNGLMTLRLEDYKILIFQTKL